MQFAVSSTSSPHASTGRYCFLAVPEALASSLKMGPCSRGPFRFSFAATSMWRYSARVAKAGGDSASPVTLWSSRASMKSSTMVSNICGKYSSSFLLRAGTFRTSKSHLFLVALLQGSTEKSHKIFLISDAVIKAGCSALSLALLRRCCTTLSMRSTCLLGKSA